MAAVKMYIDKFKGEVLIDEDHPLAIAQREKDAKAGSTGSRAENETDYASQTVADLRALCEEREIDVPVGSRKVDLVELLERSDRDSAAE